MEIPTFEECERLLFSSLRKFNIAEPFDDFLQEAYFIFNECCRKYDGRRGKFTTYFVCKFEYHLKSYLRDERRQQHIIHLLLCPPTRKDDNPIDEHLLLLDILHHYQLTTLEQDIFLLSYKGFTISKIATRKNVSLSTVKRTRKRIKQKLVENAV